MESDAAAGFGGVLVLGILALAVAFILPMVGSGLAGGLTAVLGSEAPAIENVNVPPVPAPNDHALERHGTGYMTATDIYQRWQDGRYVCVRVYRSLGANRILYRFTYGDSTLEGGILTTVGGTAVTSFAKPAAYWGLIICADGYQLMSVAGRCPPEMGCK